MALVAGLVLLEPFLGDDEQDDDDRLIDLAVKYALYCIKLRPR
jgi:hypothetical protein